MNSNEFTIWLNGFLELQDGDVAITEKQVRIIKDHLKLVFDKVTPDRKGKDLFDLTEKELNEGYKIDDPYVIPIDNTGMGLRLPTPIICSNTTTPNWNFNNSMNVDIACSTDTIPTNPDVLGNTPKERYVRDPSDKNGWLVKDIKGAFKR